MDRKLVEKIRGAEDTWRTGCLFAIDGSQHDPYQPGRDSLLELGVDVLVECPLNDRIRHMKAENFVKRDSYGRSWGIPRSSRRDNQFGFERKGTPQLLMEFGRKVWL